MHRATEAINESLKTDYIEFMELDVGSFEKIRSFVKAFKEKNQPLNILINNAGTAKYFQMLILANIMMACSNLSY